MKLNSDTIREVPVKRRISVSDFQIRVEVRAAINEVLDAGRFSEWKKVNEFETLFADYIDTKHCVAVHSGISASWSYSSSSCQDIFFDIFQAQNQPLTLNTSAESIHICTHDRIPYAQTLSHYPSASLARRKLLSDTVLSYQTMISS